MNAYTISKLAEDASVSTDIVRNYQIPEGGNMLAQTTNPSSLDLDVLLNAFPEEFVEISPIGVVLCVTRAG